eukprot:6206981-Pleurochrysis_carterae.AAC.5
MAELQERAEKERGRIGLPVGGVRCRWGRSARTKGGGGSCRFDRVTSKTHLVRLESLLSGCEAVSTCRPWDLRWFQPRLFFHPLLTSWSRSSLMREYHIGLQYSSYALHYPMFAEIGKCER